MSIVTQSEQKSVKIEMAEIKKTTVQIYKDKYKALFIQFSVPLK